MFTGSTPDITPAQLLALATFIVGQAVAFGLIDVRYQQIAVSATSAAIAIALKLADAYLRGKRAAAHGPVVHPAATPPGGVTLPG